MLIARIDKTADFPTMVEFGIKRLFRVTLEIQKVTLFDAVYRIPANRESCSIYLFRRYVRFAATVKTPFTGTIRTFGFDK